MARYFFHLFNDVDAQDREGIDYPNLAVARTKAEDLARDMAAESVRDGRLTLSHRIEVADENGRTLETVHFRDVVEVRQ